jgi:hypothetical protein
MFSYGFEVPVQIQRPICIQRDLHGRFEISQSGSVTIAYETICDRFHHDPSVQFGEMSNVRMGLKFCVRGSTIENFECDGDCLTFLIGCKEYPHTILIFECTLYMPTRKPETVLSFPSPRPVCQCSDFQRAIRKFGELCFPLLFRFSAFLASQGTMALLFR